MVQSTTYMDSKKRHDLVPEMTLGSFQNPDDDWGAFEMIELVQRMNEQFNGNTEHNAVSSFENQIIYDCKPYKYLFHNQYLTSCQLICSLTISTQRLGAWGQLMIQSIWQ